MHTIKVLELPFGKFRDKGIPIDNISNYNSSQETIICLEDQVTLSLSRVCFGTKLSMMKIVDGSEFDVSKIGRAHV